MTPTAETLNDVMEFDRVIEVHEDRSVSCPDIYPPDLHDDRLDYVDTWGDWELLDGWSNQQGYAGPLMHQSEFIGGAMADHILSTPGVYVALVSYRDDDSEQTEWAVARLTTNHQP